MYPNGYIQKKFRYRVNGETAASQRSGLMTVPITEFLRRYLRHVPEPGTKVVRCYGLYAPTKGADLARCRGQLGQGPVVQPPVLDWQTACQDRGDDHPERSPVCGHRLICLSPHLARQDSATGGRACGGGGVTSQHGVFADQLRGGMPGTQGNRRGGLGQPLIARGSPPVVDTTALCFHSWLLSSGHFTEAGLV